MLPEAFPGCLFAKVLQTAAKMRQNAHIGKFRLSPAPLESAEFALCLGQFCRLSHSERATLTQSSDSARSYLARLVATLQIAERFWPGVKGKVKIVNFIT